MKPAQWPGINPSELRHLVDVQSKSSEKDAFGQPKDTWDSVKKVRARIMAATLAESFRPEQIAAQVTHLITMRYPKGISIIPGMRVVFGSRIFRVQSLDNVQQRSILLTLRCIELFGAS